MPVYRTSSICLSAPNRRRSYVGALMSALLCLRSFVGALLSVLFCRCSFVVRSFDGSPSWGYGVWDFTGCKGNLCDLLWCHWCGMKASL